MKFLDQRQSLMVDRLVVANHVLGEVANLLVFGLLQGKFGGLDVNLTRRTDDMRNLGVVRLRGSDLRKTFLMLCGRMALAHDEAARAHRGRMQGQAPRATLIATAA